MRVATRTAYGRFTAYREAPGELRLSIRGSAHDDVGKGLERLGTPRPWSETAGDPHD